MNKYNRKRVSPNSNKLVEPMGPECSDSQASLHLTDSDALFLFTWGGHDSWGSHDLLQGKAKKTLSRFSGLETVYERLPMGNETGCSGDSGRQ